MKLVSDQEPPQDTPIFLYKEEYADHVFVGTYNDGMFYDAEFAAYEQVLMRVTGVTHWDEIKYCNKP